MKMFEEEKTSEGVQLENKLRSSTGPVGLICASGASDLQTATESGSSTFQQNLVLKPFSYTLHRPMLLLAQESIATIMWCKSCMIE